MFSDLVDPVVDSPAVRRVSSTRHVQTTIVNQDVWQEYYSSKGACTRRERRAVDRELVETMFNHPVEDDTVLALLRSLAHRAPKTKIRDELLSAVEGAIRSASWGLVKGVRRRVIARDKLLALMAIKGPNLSQVGLNEKSFWDLQLTKLLSKYPFAGYEDESEENARDEWAACEIRNAIANREISGWNENHELANELRNMMAVILGRSPSEQELIQCGSWGPGTNAGYEFGSRCTGAELKFSARLSATSGSIPLARALLPHWGLWYNHLCERFGSEWLGRLTGSKLQVVPKKFLMDRTMAAEPLWNSWLQATLGRIMRTRFRRVGLDLDNAWKFNQHAAYQGSIDGVLATLDMKNMSNRIPLLLPRSVIDPAWLSYLDSSRCDSMLLHRDGKAVWRKLEMYSSMGNGYTFELESALLLSCALIASGYHPSDLSTDRNPVGKTICVFGDDVIIPSCSVEGFIEICKEIGFEVNSEKSYWKGPFRESCGMDYYNGVNVRPLFISDRIENVFETVRLANRVLEFAFRDSVHSGDHASSRWAGVWALAHNLVPSRLRSLLSTPPGVPGGLWSIGSSVLADWSGTGQPVPSYKVIVDKTSNIVLSQEMLCYESPCGSHVSYLTGNGDNLLAARVGPTQTAPWSQDRWYQLKLNSNPGSVGEKGDFSSLRFTKVGKIVTSPAVVSTTWLGWRSLYTDFPLWEKACSTR